MIQSLKQKVKKVIYLKERNSQEIYTENALLLLKVIYTVCYSQVSKKKKKNHSIFFHSTSFRSSLHRIIFSKGRGKCPQFIHQSISVTQEDTQFVLQRRKHEQLSRAKFTDYKCWQQIKQWINALFGLFTTFYYPNNKQTYGTNLKPFI